MSRHVQENVISAIVILMLLGFLVLSFQYGPRARLVPVPVAIIGLVLMVLQLVYHNTGREERLKVDLMDVVRRGQGGAKATEELHEAEEDEEAHTAKDAAGAGRIASSGRRAWISAGLVVLFTGLVLLLGPLAGIFLFVTGYFGLVSGYRWLYSVLFSGALTAVLYLFFVELLETQLYYGILSPIFLP